MTKYNDLNSDGKVNIKDKLLLSSKFGKRNIDMDIDMDKFDLNNDNKINILDLLELNDYINDYTKTKIHRLNRNELR